MIYLVYCGYEIIVSIVTIIFFLVDKSMSKGGTEKRIKEKTLLGLAVFGGALGAFIGRIVCHHKTNKIYFSVVIYLSLLIQLSLVALAVWSFIQMGGLA